MTRPKMLVECVDCGSLIASGRIFRDGWNPEKETYCPACERDDDLGAWKPWIWDSRFKGYREPTKDEFLEMLVRGLHRKTRKKRIVPMQTCSEKETE